jgi:Flp pilus assembly protein TadD
MTNWCRKFFDFHLAGAFVLAVSLGACSTNPVYPPDIAPLTNYHLYDIPDVDLLHVSPEMQGFVTHYASEGPGTRGKAWSLAYAVLDPYLFDFDYDPQITLPADETFMAKTGNCLSFSSMFVAMARQAGLNAWYQEIEIPPNWSNVKDTILVSKHVNAVVEDTRNTFTVDVSGRKQKENDVARRLSDQEAKAQYFNNLGADALIADDLDRAYAFFKKALGIDTSLVYVWTNMGVVYRRNGQTNDAITVYRFALQLEPGQAVALNNLFLIYQEDGDLAEAAVLKKRVEKTQRKNPYYLHYLAEVALEEQRFSEAIDLLNKAIKIEDGEYRFYYTLAQSQYYAGETEIARVSLEQARQLAPDKLEDGPLTLPDQTL